MPSVEVYNTLIARLSEMVTPRNWAPIVEAEVARASPRARAEPPLFEAIMRGEAVHAKPSSCLCAACCELRLGREAASHIFD